MKLRKIKKKRKEKKRVTSVNKDSGANEVDPRGLTFFSLRAASLDLP
jgi:hypothetical protein